MEGQAETPILRGGHKAVPSGEGYGPRNQFSWDHPLASLWHCEALAIEKQISLPELREGLDWDPGPAGPGRRWWGTGGVASREA